MLRYIIKTITIPDDKVVIVHDDLIMQLLKVYSVGGTFFFVILLFCFGAEWVGGIFVYTQDHHMVKRRILQWK